MSESRADSTRSTCVVSLKEVVQHLESMSKAKGKAVRRVSHLLTILILVPNLCLKQVRSSGHHASTCHQAEENLTAANMKIDFDVRKAL